MKKAKKNSIAKATRHIIALVTGEGVAKRIAADAKKPVINSRTDGVIFDPRWQDDGATHGLK
jgi:hypothetical protein